MEKKNFLIQTHTLNFSPDVNLGVERENMNKEIQTFVKKHN